MEEVLIEKDKVGFTKEESENQSNQDEKGVTIEQLIDKNTPLEKDQETNF